MEKDTVLAKLIKVQEKLYGLERKHYFLDFKKQHLETLAYHIAQFYQDASFLDRFAHPFFSEELKVDRKEVLDRLLFVVKEEDVPILLEKFKAISLPELLLALGQRITSATIQNTEGIHTLDAVVFTTCLAPYNEQLSKAVRAFEKHAERSTNSFWGKVTGNPLEKENKVKEILQAILQNKTWWNVYYHYKHELVYEVRMATGHGVRCKLSPMEFIGLVEPFVV